MHRDIDALTGSAFDVLVVGGGIYGLTIACDAAQRGLSTALIEREDFGCGASFNHLRTIHGGLRYLQSLDLGRAAESARERRILARIAPQAVRPLAFALPITRSLATGKLAYRAGFWLDRLLSAGRNRGVMPELRLPAGRVISRDEAIQRFPGLKRRGLVGAAVWYDYETIEADRLTFSWALAAGEHGGAIANYVEATAIIVAEDAVGKRVSGARARDRETGREIEIAARVIVNATGAAVDRLCRPLGLPPLGRFLKAMNLVTRRDAGDEALGARTDSGRHLFLVPWRGRALFGTWESERAAEPDDHAIEVRQPETGGAQTADAPDVLAFVTDLNRAFPSLDLMPDDITLVHCGFVPARAAGNGRLKLETREWVRDHAADGIEGLISVAGVKYTTARAVAERVTDRVVAKLGRAPTPCRTASTPLPGGAILDLTQMIADARREHDDGLPSDAIPHLVGAYGSRYRDVLALGDKQPAWRARISDASPIIGAEIIWAVRQEMALRLVDAVVRRTPLGAVGFPGDQAAERAASLAGAELGWSEARRLDEYDALRRFYGLVTKRVGSLT